MTTDLERLQRIRDIDDKDITQEDNQTFFVKSQSDKNGETFYMIYFGTNTTTCTCRDFLFRNTEESPNYTCKHIDKVREMIIRRIKK